MVGPKPVRTKAVKPKSQEKTSLVKKVKESSASEEASVKKKSVEEKKDDGNNNENDKIISECAGASVEEDQVCHQRMFHVLLDHF